MGLRSRLKNKLKGTLEGVGALAKVIHDEANHPGRPQPHMAARNPLWGGGEVERTDSVEDSVPEDSNGQTIQPPTTEPEADYWFLHDPDGEADDWSKTNPKG
jgi:hypothetical protein